MPQTQPLQPGDPEALGSFRIVGRLGEGAQGVVYAATAADGSAVAIKLLHSRLGEDRVEAERFLREVAAARRVAQFCTAQVLGAHMEGSRPYIVSELVDGVSLQRIVMDQGPRTGGSLYRLAVGTVTALAAIHRAGIVHRDFKPSNVLLGQDGPRVIDFGIARALDSGVTLSSGVVGTPAYMSPEQVAAHRVGPPSDMFSWAVTMTFAATGRPVFGFDSLPAVIYRVMNEIPDVSRLPDRLRPIVEACLAKKPEQRPTAAEALFSLLDHQSDESDQEPIGADALGLPAASPISLGAPPPAPPPAKTGPDPDELERSLTHGWQVAAALPQAPAAPVRPAAAVSGKPAAPPVHEDGMAVTKAVTQQESFVAPAPPSPPPPGDQRPDALFSEEDRPRKNRTGIVTGALIAALALAATALFVVPALLGKNSRQQPVAQVTSSATLAASAGVPSSGASPAATGPSPAPTTSASPAAQMLVTIGAEIGSPLKGHSKAVYSVASGTLKGDPIVASTGLDGRLRIWAAGSGKSSGKPINAGGGEVYAVATAQVGGRTLAITGGYDGVLRLFDLSSRKSAGTIFNGGGAVYTVAVGTLNGTPVAVTGGEDGRIRIWNLKTRRMIGSPFRATRSVINWLAFSTLDGREVVAVAAGDGTARVWDLGKRKAYGKPYKGHKKGVYSVAFGTRGDRAVVISGGKDSKIRVWDPKTAKPVGSALTGHHGNVYSLASGTVGGLSILVSGSTDGTIRLWDADAGKALGKAVKAHKGGVLSVAIVSVDSDPVIVSAGKDHKVKLWRVVVPVTAS
ncbi:serine/threonine protein kinase [Streptosporangiaceae bacterium NEAU-GS5]|nr:serine/threonine protein kinase [Streptosporangiaceae bacterium NEAU-GS5]